MAAGGGGGQGGFDYNAWAAMNLNKGGGDNSGPADTMDDITKKGVDKAVSTIFAKFLGIMNPEIEGHGVIPHETNVSQGFSLAQGGLLGIFKDTGGVLSKILKYFTRDLPAGLMEAIGANDGGSASSGGSSGDYGSSSSSGGDYAAAGGVGGGMGGGMGGGEYAGGGGGMPSMGGGADYGESMVNYGGKMIVAAVPESDLGQLQPSAGGGGGRSRDMDTGMAM